MLVDDEEDCVKTPTERIGACAYLEKPVNLDTLIGTIRKALSKKRDELMVAGVFTEAGTFDSAEEHRKGKYSSRLYEGRSYGNKGSLGG